MSHFKIADRYISVMRRCRQRYNLFNHSNQKNGTGSATINLYSTDHFKTQPPALPECTGRRTEEQARERISDHSNPLIWIATHTVWASYNILKYLGSPVENPFKAMFENFKAYDPIDIYPYLETVKTEWRKIGGLIKKALHEVTEEYLAAESLFKSPIGEFTNAGAVAFLVQHESFSIGQMAYLKKYFTREAMKF
jgi:hypothetical protein